MRERSIAVGLGVVGYLVVGTRVVGAAVGEAVGASVALFALLMAGKSKTQIKMLNEKA